MFGFSLTRKYERNAELEETRDECDEIRMIQLY